MEKETKSFSSHTIQDSEKLIEFTAVVRKSADASLVFQLKYRHSF